MLSITHERGGVPPSALGHWAVLVAAALAAAVLCWLLAPGHVAAQEPTPPIIAPGDPRSEGAGPGFGSGPLLAALIVLAIGVLAALATIAYVRLSKGR